MINVANQTFIICKNPNRPQEQKSYLISYNGIAYPEDDHFSVLRDPAAAIKFETFADATRALSQIKEDYVDAEIMVLECGT